LPNKEHWVSGDEYSAMYEVCKKVLSNLFRLQIAEMVYNLEEFDETDYSQVSSAAIIQRIKEFLSTDPSEISCTIFLNLIARYPIGMCSPHPSPILKSIMGFIYHAGQPTPQQEKEGIEKVSMEEVSEWFLRSKATIKEYVDTTEGIWKEIQRRVEEEKLRKKAKDIALKELVEEEKQKLLSEKQLNNQTNRTNTLEPTEEDNIPVEK
jgi:hypothetical protein